MGRMSVGDPPSEPGPHGDPEKSPGESPEKSNETKEPVAASPQSRIRALIQQARDEGDPSRSAELYEQAHRLDLNDPMAMSYYGMSLAVHRNFHQQGIVFCEEAVRRMGPHPDLLLNLARALLASRNKKEAVRVLRRALARSQGHPRVISELVALGLRATPVIPFLPRSFFVNKYLGMFRHWLKGLGRERDDGRRPLPAELGRLSGNVDVVRQAMDEEEEERP